MTSRCVASFWAGPASRTGRSAAHTGTFLVFCLTISGNRAYNCQVPRSCRQQSRVLVQVRGKEIGNMKLKKLIISLSISLGVLAVAMYTVGNRSGSYAQTGNGGGSGGQTDGIGG